LHRKTSPFFEIYGNFSEIPFPLQIDGDFPLVSEDGVEKRKYPEKGYFHQLVEKDFFWG